MSVWPASGLFPFVYECVWLVLVPARGVNSTNHFLIAAEHFFFQLLTFTKHLSHFPHFSVFVLALKRLDDNNDDVRQTICHAATFSRLHGVLSLRLV